MATNQLHGKQFEDIIKASSLFSGSSDFGRNATSKFDIEAKFDKIKNLPTSIKVSKGNIVGLSDARRFWSLDEDFRLLVSKYKQLDDRKSFYEIHEFKLDSSMLEILRGDLSFKEIENLHNGISLENFPLGKEKEARKWFRNEKQKLKNKLGFIKLNPKIDSKGQRRLQCSVSILDLVSEIKKMNESNYILHDQSYGVLTLPIALISSSRIFNRKK